MNMYELLTTLPRNDILALQQAGLLAPTTLKYISVYESVDRHLQQGTSKMQAYCNAGMEQGYTEDHVRKVIRLMNRRILRN